MNAVADDEQFRARLRLRLGGGTHAHARPPDTDPAQNRSVLCLT
jgi:hypothetical protein